MLFPAGWVTKIYDFLNWISGNITTLQGLLDRIIAAVDALAALDPPAVAVRLEEGLASLIKPILDAFAALVNLQDLPAQVRGFVDRMRQWLDAKKAALVAFLIGLVQRFVGGASTPTPGGASGDQCAAKEFHYRSTPRGGGTWTDFVVTNCSGSTTNVPMPHGHHIVMKGVRFPESGQARQILCKYDINPYTDCANLVISPNRCHSAAYARRVLLALQTADRDPNANRATIVAVLAQLAVVHRRCTDGGVVEPATDDA